jgi:hypothetical protein
MTLDEKMAILSLDFKIIWYKCFLSYHHDDKKVIKGRKKFDKFFMKDNNVSILSMIKSSDNVELIWEIPKGHMNKNESIINSAIREFHEETSICKLKYKILYDITPITYTFIDDNVKYIYTYYIAVMLDNKYNPKVNAFSTNMTGETNEIKFLPLDMIKVINEFSGFSNLIKKIIKIAKNHIIT